MNFTFYCEYLLPFLVCFLKGEMCLSIEWKLYTCRNSSREAYFYVFGTNFISIENQEIMHVFKLWHPKHRSSSRLHFAFALTTRPVVNHSSCLGM